MDKVTIGHVTKALCSRELEQLGPYLEGLSPNTLVEIRNHALCAAMKLIYASQYIHGRLEPEALTDGMAHILADHDTQLLVAFILDELQSPVPMEVL